MKTKYFFAAVAGLALTASLTGCEDEKDLIIIEGNLPIKTSTLYMCGDATPTGWSIDTPTEFTASDEDPLVFAWQGTLNSGELKLCLTTGSFDAAFIRPETAGLEISSADITDATFKMHAGDPDDKWKVTEPGVYTLTFNLRDWTYSTRFMSAPPAVEIEPIKTEVLYMVGDATPAGWNIDAPYALEKTGQYTFKYNGLLNLGELKCCLTPGSWDVSFIRPASDGCAINKDGVEAPGFIYSANPDNKWKVGVAGTYELIFDLENWTISATFLEEHVVEKNPIETETLFMIGDATPGGWSMDDATAFTADASNKYLFSWQGELVPGSMKACLVQDGTFSCPFIRPEFGGCKIDASGVESRDFVFTTAPDDQWSVQEAGEYKIVFDLENWTISVTKLDGGNTPVEPSQPTDPSEKAPLETSTLYMIGDATPGGWSMDDATAFTSTEDYIFTWEGELTTGDMKACLVPDGTFSCPFLRPSHGGCKIGATGVEHDDFVYTTDPDDKWTVETAGRYRITFNLKNWTITAVKL